MKERIIENWRNDIEAIMRSDGMVRESPEPKVEIDYSFGNSGLVKAQAIINEDISRSLRELSKNKIETDVFLLSCTGHFSLSPKDISLDCSIINEDGLPVTLVKEIPLQLITERVNVTASRIIESFREA
jgi:hypothetical protein